MLISDYQLAATVTARVRREEGQAMSEYAILVTVIAAVVLAAAFLLGTHISSVFTSVANRV